MTRVIFTVFLAVLLAATSCKQSGKSFDEGKIEGNTYTSEEIGWTIQIPEDWTIMTKDEAEDKTEKGMKAIENTVKSEVDISTMKNLIGFKKDQFNIFQSTSESFKAEYAGEWEEDNAVVKQVIYGAFKDQGIKVDSSATTTETIDGLEFSLFSFTIYGPSGDTILQQMLYGRYINGFDFGVNINYNNAADRDRMLAAWRASTFRKSEK